MTWEIRTPTRPPVFLPQPSQAQPARLETSLSAQDRLILDTHNKQDRLHADLLALGMSDLDVLKLKRCTVRIRGGMHAHGWM